MCLLPSAFLAAQQPTFRAGVDIVAVDVQVVDKEGRPLSTLQRGDFDVWLDGHRRRVVSADLVRYSEGSPGAVRDAARPPNVTALRAAPRPAERTIVLAVDESSFDATSWMGHRAAVERFLDHVQPDDLVGLYVYPFNEPKLDLTHDRDAVRRTLDSVVGRYEAASSRFYIGASEIVDFTVGDRKVLGEVAARECGPERGCVQQVENELIQAASFLEMAAAQSLGALRTLLEGLATLPGPKIVILMSERLISSDRVGGRPDLSGRLTGIAEAVAAANARLYVVHIDDSFIEATSAANGPVADPSARVVNQMRDAHVAASGLEQLAGRANGSYMQIAAGTADRAFDRVLRETTAYYLLGVRTEPEDRDGRTHVVRVSVRAKDGAVQHRTQVVIPRER